jgi:hypothetical protein
MKAGTHRNAAKRKTLLRLSSLLLLIGAIMWLRSDSWLNQPPPNDVFVAKLLSAQHYHQPNPKPTFNLLAFKPISFRPASLREAAMAVIGMEPRELSAMESGDSEFLFGCLSAFGGYGEIIWVDKWGRLPIKMPPATTTGSGLVVRRRRAMQAAVRAIRASGGCLIKAGPHRYLVAKISEKKDYEAAIRALGWLHGVPPPWETEDQSAKTNAELFGAANGSQPIRSETSRTSSAAGSRR